jgi:ATP-dependent Lon protease
MDSPAQGTENLKQKITAANLPPEIQEKLLNLIRFPGEGAQFEKLVSYIEFVIGLPFEKFGQDILDLHRAKEILDKNHYGLESVKSRILEYLSVLILKSRNKTEDGHAPILAFVGLVGTGKTSLAYSIAESLGRPIIRIPFGGLGDPRQLRGESRVSIEAEAGQVMKAIKIANVKNPVILLDEIDRVAEGSKVDIMGILVELLDPAQNQAFVDHYLDFPFDLSKVLFIATANNTGNIATAVMDRLEPIQMPAYTDEEKLVIGKDYLLPRAIKESGLLTGQLEVGPEVWSSILRPLGFDAGIRSLNRAIEGLTRKVARKVVEGETGPFKITNENIGEYIT